MLRCLNCGREIAAEYDSQVCAHCAGERPRPVRRWRLSVRRFCVRLKLLPAMKSMPSPRESQEPV